MTQTEKFVKLILPHIVALVKAQENLEKMHNILDKYKNPSVHVIGKEKQMIDLLHDF